MLHPLIKSTAKKLNNGKCKGLFVMLDLKTNPMRTNINNLLTPCKDITVVILEYLANNDDMLNINTNTGSVSINCKTLDFNYCGDFGGKLLSHLINKKISLSDTTQKLIYLSAHITAYGEKVGGVTLSNSKN